MSNLAIMTTVLGGVMVFFYALFVLVPDRMRMWLKLFPRNKWAGAVLAAVDLGWVAWLILNAPLGRFEHLKPLVYFLAPVTFLLVLKFMTDLLAPRALGVLLLLIPTPILAEARLHDSGFRYVMIVLAYILVIKGIMLVLSPHMFRKGAEIVAKSNGKCRLCGAIGLVFAIFILLLGITVY